MGTESLGTQLRQSCWLASFLGRRRSCRGPSSRAQVDRPVDKRKASYCAVKTPTCDWLTSPMQDLHTFTAHQSAFLSGPGRRWRRRRRRLADGSAAGESTLCPRFGKASAFSKTQPHRESDSQHSQSPGGSLRMLFAAHRLGQRSGARPTTFIPIHPGGRVANHQPQ